MQKEGQHITRIAPDSTMTKSRIVYPHALRDSGQAQARAARREPRATSGSLKFAVSPRRRTLLHQIHPRSRTTPRWASWDARRESSNAGPISTGAELTPCHESRKQARRPCVSDPGLSFRCLKSSRAPAQIVSGRGPVMRASRVVRFEETGAEAVPRARHELRLWASNAECALAGPGRSSGPPPRRRRFHDFFIDPLFRRLAHCFPS